MLLVCWVGFSITGSSSTNSRSLTQPTQPVYHYLSLGKGRRGCPWGWTVEGSTVGEPLYTNASAMTAQRGIDFKEKLEGPLDER